MKERVGRVSTFAEILVRTGRACLSGYPCSAVLRLVALDGVYAQVGTWAWLNLTPKQLFIADGIRIVGKDKAM